MLWKHGTALSHPHTSLHEVHCLKDGHVLDLLADYLTIKPARCLRGVGLEEEVYEEEEENEEVEEGREEGEEEQKKKAEARERERETERERERTRM